MGRFFRTRRPVARPAATQGDHIDLTRTQAATARAQPAPAAPPPGTVPGRRVSYPDLGAVVHVDEAPAELTAELPALYSSSFSTLEYFTLYDRARPAELRVCELVEPRHVIVFRARGATAEVLNKVIDIGPHEVERVAAAIFRARPELRRIHAEVKFPPAELALPHRELYRADDQVVELPGSVEEYEASLGRSTRNHLRDYRNQVRRRYPGFELRIVAGDELTPELVARALAWNRELVRGRGEEWIYEQHPAWADKTWRLLRRHGVALCGFIDGELVDGQFLLFVGRDCWGYASGLDPSYRDVHLGTVMVVASAREAIARGCARLHLGWGSVEYKRHLGARPVIAWRVALYRSRLDRALYARERWRLLVRDRNDLYWALRGALKRRLKPAPSDHAPETLPEQAPTA